MPTKKELEEEMRSVLEEECLCKDCPSYVKCGEMGGYCFQQVGKSKCIKKMRGCECGACSITKMEGLTGMYYCVKGAAKKGGAVRKAKPKAKKAVKTKAKPKGKTVKAKAKKKRK